MLAQRAEARRTAMKEEITLMLKGGGEAHEEGGERADLVRTVPRFRLEIERVNKLFGIDVAYVQDESGGLVMPEDFMWHCMPPPFKYYVVERAVPELPEDVHRDPWYFGSSQVVLSDVPLTVGAADLVTWLQKGVEKQDLRLQAVVDERIGLETQLRRNKERLDNVPFVTIEAVSDQGKAEERLLLTKTLQRDREQLQRDMAELEPRLNRELKRRKVQQVKLHQTEVRELEKTSTWHAAFANAREADAALGLDSWDRLMLFVGTEHDPPLAVFDSGGKDGEEEPPPERLDDEVVMRGVRLRRVAHGEGGYTDWAWGESYRGGFVEGERHGHGVHHEKQGVYRGEFDRDHRCGLGRQVLASGDEYEGEFGHTLQHPTRPLLGGRDYAIGRPHGVGGELRFADGCSYRGELKDGVITGQGEYRDPATGEMLAGSFVDGVLHGMGIHVKPNGERFEGRFRHGQLHGKGAWASKRNPRKAHTCTGVFENGEPHGFCRHVHRKGPRYTGFYRDGVRDGPGDLTYGNVAEYFHRLTGQVRQRHDFEYQGTWVAGTIQGRNCHVEACSEPAKGAVREFEPFEQMFFTSRHMWTRYPFLQQLVHKEERERGQRCRELRRSDQEQRKRLRKVTKENMAAFKRSRRFAIRLYKAVYRRLEAREEGGEGGAQGGDEGVVGEEEEEEYAEGEYEEGEELYEDEEEDDDNDDDEEDGDDDGGLEYCDSDWFSTGSRGPGPGHMKQDLSAIKVSLSDVIEHPFTLQLSEKPNPHVTAKVVDAFLSELLREALVQPSY